MKNLAFVLGFLAGLTLVFLVSFLIKLKNKNRPCKYDERQRLSRGKAFETAFWVLIAYLCCNGIFNLLTGIEWADMLTSSFVGVLIAITIFAIECINNDAYFPINRKPGFYIILFAIVIVCNLAVSLINLLGDPDQFMTDGMLNFHILNPLIVIMFFAVLIAAAGKAHRAKKQFGSQVEL